MSSTKSFSSVKAEILDLCQKKRKALPGNAAFLADTSIYCGERNDGDSRYPYGQGAMTTWVYSSGYIHANQGRFNILQRAAEGQDPPVAFFMGLAGTKSPWEPLALTTVPASRGPCDALLERFTVFRPSSAWFFTRTSNFLATLRVHVNQENHIIFTVELENTSAMAQSSYLASAMNPFVAHQLFESSEYRWFRDMAYHELGDLGCFVTSVNEDLSRTKSVQNHCTMYRRGEFTGEGRITRHWHTSSREEFTGSRHVSIQNARSLLSGAFSGEKPRTSFTETGIAGDIIHVELEPGACFRLDFVLETGALLDGIPAIDQNKIPSATLIDRNLAELENREERSHSTMDLRLAGSAAPGSPDGETLCAFYQHLKRQVRLTAVHRGYIDLTDYSFIGVRDIYQGMEALSWWQAPACREKILEALGFTFPDGRCPRQYSLSQDTSENRFMDLRLFIDQGNWIISSLCSYLKISGDSSLLEEPCGYHEIVDEESKIVRPVEERDSVLSHLERILGFLLGSIDPETGCLRALYGDWNDALDGLGVPLNGEKGFGSGVSVMASLHLYQNLLEMAEILEWSGQKDTRYLASDLRSMADKLAENLEVHGVEHGIDGITRIIHGWGDKRSYKVGSSNDPDGKARDGLTAPAFWVLSGLHQRKGSYRSDILKAFERLDAPLGMQTFKPAFERDCPGVGRIPKLPPGTAENAASYLHASAFGAMALFKLGEAEKGWQQICKILPFCQKNVSLSPFVMPNSYCFNPSKGINGESMGDWRTGSANVVMKTLLGYLFGIQPGFQELVIAPAAWQPYSQFDLTVILRGQSLRLVYRREGASQRRFVLDGKACAPTWNPGLSTWQVQLPMASLGRHAMVVEVFD